MPLLRRALAAIDTLNTIGAGFAAVSAALLAAMLIVEVVTTSAFAWSQPWAVEYSGYLLAFVLFCGSGWALRTGGHIRVGALVGILPPRAQWVLDLAASAFALGIVGFAAWTLVAQALRTAALGSRSSFTMETPLVVPQGCLAAGFVLLALAFAARLLRLLIGEAAEERSAHAGTIE